MKRGTFYLLGFLLLMLFDSIGAISFKYAGDHALPVEANMVWLLRIFTHPWVYGAVVGYIGAFFTWMTLLKHAPIGPAFAASHLEVVSVMLLSVWLFNEHLTIGRLLGALAILLGIVCLGFAESREHVPDAADSETTATSAKD
jgi:drug/metabolite transporter (DMT)-like permease